MVGITAPMRRAYGLLHQCSAYAYPVLITGEAGTGKKLAAETIHSLSLRKSKAFVVVDFSKLAPTLAESELFGYEKGAFAGALDSQWGLLAFAREGTLLLKEVGDLPLRLQGRILQTLHDKEFTPIGSARPVPFGARILATTSRDLQGEVKRGRFREDLLLTLSITQISLPPLRERKEDILLLVDYFLAKYEGAESKTKFSPGAIQQLCGYDWPGNVRELEEKVRAAISARTGAVIEAADLALSLHSPDDRRWAAGLSSYFDQREREAILRALRESDGDKTAAAKSLGMGESALQKRLEYYRI